jgi:hypothetical protein
MHKAMHIVSVSTIIVSGTFGNYLFLGRICRDKYFNIYASYIYIYIYINTHMWVGIKSFIKVCAMEIQ